MVILGKREKERETKPPNPSCFQWGNQKFLCFSKPAAGEFPGYRISDGGVEAVRKKVMMDFQAETERVMREKGCDEREGLSVKRPIRGRRERGSGSGEKREFSVSMSRREIEGDFGEMLGGRLPRRPRKRSRAVQKQLDDLFPALWLPEITPDFYKVTNDAQPGKK